MYLNLFLIHLHLPPFAFPSSQMKACPCEYKVRKKLLLHVADRSEKNINNPRACGFCQSVEYVWHGTKW